MKQRSSGLCETLINIYEANVNAENDESKMPLHMAATVGHLEVCQFLVEKGANVKAVDVSQ